MTTEIDDQQRVLSEVSHDLANRFHRSYYFLELLGDAVGPDNEAAVPLLAGLRDTVEDIEATTRSTLDFLRNVELRKVRVRLEDLAASLRQHVGLRGVEVGGDAEAGRREVDVDPARISESLACLCKAATRGDESQATVAVDLLDGDPVAIRIHCTAGATLPAGADLGLALTSRIARLHGGALDIEAAAAGAFTLRLPVAGREG